MLDNLFDTVINSSTGTTPAIFIALVLTSLVLGLALAFVHMYKATYSKSFIMTLAILPAVVCVVILMVNGNIGAGVAVAGTFSLVRFRSAPGSAREIVVLFAAVCAGLIMGMGYIAYAVLFTLIIGLAIMILSATSLGEHDSGCSKSLHITIPEDLNYTDAFDDLFADYTSSHRLVLAKTSNMGSMFRLHYEIVLKSADKEKEFIDKLRCRNGNLEISISDLSSVPTVEQL
ncbi:MAG: DUF4956 domain-containing protein [Saccharofermentans sp.]|jgi:hypothetical protein|nr:DUF4956 domain-containing protein [Mageeibacillus sp.]MCI1263497.1 DUF4956 domain-containing protein [Saccharofermentans sp.]MCI1275101.1 DUF4956 domain-containing protein [Saccharofermentans sp.]MCI2044165.1 DUF4956 domain-containing protein [Mageeibacillus sp.]